MSALGRYDYVAKLLIVGDVHVGKTAFLKRFADSTFTEAYTSTIGIDFKFKCIHVGDRIVKVTVVRFTQWDTCGQERFRTIGRTYYKDCQGIILGFDFTSEKSFANVRNWLQEIRINAGPDVSVVLIGTKSDMSERVVSVQQAKDLSAELGLSFYETSAKSGLNVEEVFMFLVQAILTRTPEHPDRSFIKLEKKSVDGKKKKRCC